MGLTVFVLPLFCCSFLSVCSQSHLEQPVNLCAELSSSSTESRLFDRVFRCFPQKIQPSPSLCMDVSRCIADVLVELTSIDVGDAEGTSSQATAAFVLVETLRKYFSATLIASDSSSCSRRDKLAKIIEICGPEEEIPYYGFGSTENDVDPKLLAGYDILIKSIARYLGSADSIVKEMMTVQKQKLWQGLVAIIFTFSCPGVMAIFSPAHFQIISVVQVLGMALLFLYVTKQVGILYAVGAVSICVVIFVAQCLLIYCCCGSEETDSSEHAHRQ